MKIHLIWAQEINGGIGKNGRLPWHIPEDLQNFKKLTLDSTILMGRNTWESLPRRPLPKRRNIVLSSKKVFNVECYTSVEGCIEKLIDDDIDKLFDGGYISFSDDGYILTSTRLNTDVLSLWHIDNLINIGVINTSIHIGKFNEKQKEYLHFHRMHVYKASDPITNAELQIKDLPNVDDLNAIEEFCLTFDGYAHCSIVSCDANIPLIQKEVKLQSRKYLSDLRLELFYAHPHFQSVRGDENPEDTLFDLYNELYPIFVETINNKTSRKKKV